MTRNELQQKTISWLLSENKKLRAFAREVMESWPDGGIEGVERLQVSEEFGVFNPAKVLGREP